MGIFGGGRFATVTFTSLGTLLASCWYDLKSGRMYPNAGAVTADGLHALALSRRNPNLPDIRSDTTLRSRVWSLNFEDVANRAVSTIPITLGNRDDNVPVRWSADSQTMFTVNLDSTLTCWDARTGQERLTFQTGLQRITRMEVSPRDDAVALADEHGGVAVIRARAPFDPADMRPPVRSGSEQ